MRLEWFNLILKTEILNAKPIFWTSFSSSVGMFSKCYFEKLQNELDFAQYLGKCDCMCVCVRRWGCITLLHEVCLTGIFMRALDTFNAPAETKPSHNTFKCSDVKEKTVSERSLLTLNWSKQLSEFEKFFCTGEI